MAHATYVFEGHIVAEQPLATCSKDLLDRKGRKNQPVPVPSTQTEKGERLMFPATGLRGGIRRACRDVVRRHVMEKQDTDTPFDLDTHFFLTLGGIKGAGEEDKGSISRIADLREKNPLINLFGAGDAGTVGFVAGRTSIGNAICQDPLEPVIFSGARSDDIYRDPSQADFLSDADLVMLTEISSGNRELSRMKGESAKLRRAYAEAKSNGEDDKAQQAGRELDALAEKIEQTRADSGSKNSVGMPLAGWQAIPQGAVMDHRMVIRRATQVDIGLFLASLSAFSLEPFVGGHYASGNGLVSAEWDVYEVSLTKGKQLVGKVKLAPFDLADIEGETLTQAHDAFTAFMASGDWDFSVPEKA